MDLKKRVEKYIKNTIKNQPNHEILHGAAIKDGKTYITNMFSLIVFDSVIEGLPEAPLSEIVFELYDNIKRTHKVTWQKGMPYMGDAELPSLKELKALLKIAKAEKHKAIYLAERGRVRVGDGEYAVDKLIEIIEMIGEPMEIRAKSSMSALYILGQRGVGILSPVRV